MRRVTGTRVGVAALTALGLALPMDSAHAAPRPQHSAKHAVPGDFDGDGRRDLAVSSVIRSRVQVRYTHAQPNGSHIAWLRPHATSFGNPRFGWDLAVGDFDRDGYSDLAVGAIQYQPTPVPDEVAQNGAVFVLYGSSVGLRTEPQVLVGPDEGLLGDFVAVGDVNGDGYADIAATQEASDGLRLYYGSKTGIRPQPSEFGGSFDGRIAVGDVNGDGYADLVGTDHSTETQGGESGTVRMWAGRAAGIARRPQSISGRKLGVIQTLGGSVATGDINRDGYADVVVGNPYDGPGETLHNRGSIVVLLGGRGGLSAGRSTRITAGRVGPANPDEQFGSSVDIARVSGDKYSDVAIGAPGTRISGHESAGAVYLLSGSAAGLRAHDAQRITLASPHVPGAVRTNASFGVIVHLAQHVDGPNADLYARVDAPGDTHLLRFTGTDAGLSRRSAVEVRPRTPTTLYADAVV